MLSLTVAPGAALASSVPRDTVVTLRTTPYDAAVQEDEDERAPDDEALPPYPASPPGRRAGPAHGSTIGPNVRMNSFIDSPANNGEAEVSIAAIGSRLVSAWNDGRTFGSQPGFVGYGYSSTGGQSWFDGGSLPVATATDIYYGDPVMAADPAGDWDVADLYPPIPGTTAISVNHRSFTDTAPAWDLPVVVASSDLDLLDKPWITVDPVSGFVYCAWVRFASSGQWIEFSRSQDHGAHWTPLQQLTSPD